MIKRAIDPEKLKPAPAPLGYNIKPKTMKNVTADKVVLWLTIAKNKRIRKEIAGKKCTAIRLEREMRENKEELEKLSKKLVKSVRVDVAPLLKSKAISKMFFYRGALYFVTNPLIFRGNDGTEGSTDTIELDGLNIGRVLVAIEPYYSGSATDAIRVYGIDWTINQNTPISPVVSGYNSICFGDNLDTVTDLTRKGRIAEVLPYIIKSLTRPDYATPYRSIKACINRAMFWPDASIATAYLIDIVNGKRDIPGNTENRAMLIDNCPEIEETYQISRDFLTKTLPKKYPEIAKLKNIQFDLNNKKI